jgi:hypothetical protein
MKMKLLFEYLSVTLVSLWLISGCDAISRSVVVSTVPLSSSPTLTFTPTFALQSTSTSTPTISPVLVSSFTAEQIQTNILASIDGNGGCKFPCWLGITPGQTNRDKALTQLEQIGFSPVLDPKRGWYYDKVWYSDPIEGNSIGYEIHLQDQIVSYIHVKGEGYSNLTLFHRIWKSVSPDSIITKYGTPSRVWIESYFSSCEGSGLCNTTPYNLWLFFDKQGFLIIYSGLVDLKSIYTFCPTFSEAGNLGGRIEFYSKSIGDTKPLEDFTGLSPVKLTNPKDLDSITGMSLVEFATHYEQPNQPFCFSTPRNIWPK